MQTDNIADMLIRIKNAQSRNKSEVEVPYSKMNENIANVIKSKGCLTEVTVFKPKGKSYRMLSLAIKYDASGRPAISSLERVSKSGLRVYTSANDIKFVSGGLGFYVVSTSRGVLASDEARKKKLGGELVCKVN